MQWGRKQKRTSGKARTSIFFAELAILKIFAKNFSSLEPGQPRIQVVSDWWAIRDDEAILVGPLTFGFSSHGGSSTSGKPMRIMFFGVHVRMLIRIFYLHNQPSDQIHRLSLAGSDGWHQHGGSLRFRTLRKVEVVLFGFVFLKTHFFISLTERPFIIGIIFYLF